MAVLPLQNFTALVANMAAAVQASALSLLNLTVGSALRAVLEANASVALWLQWLILQVLALTRAATSSGSDLDSWMADFSFVRLAANFASGLVTFSRFTNTTIALILVGSQVKTFDGTQTFTVTADAANPAWNGSTGYTLAAGVTNLTVPVVAVNSGVQGNVLAGSIGLLASAIPGVDSVTNALAYSNGIDTESDPSFRARFALYLATRSRATPMAVAFAVSSVQQGLTYSIVENATAGGVYTPGTFVVTFDDGSGAVGGSLLTSVTAAVQAVRPIGSVAIVQGASMLAANVSMTIVCATTALHTQAVPLVAAAISGYIGAIWVGASLPYSVLAKLAYDASPNVLNVTSILLNGATADLAATSSQAIRAGTIVVN